MIRFFRDLFRVFRQYTKGLLIILTSLTALVIIGIVFFSYKTQQSSFCDSCHYMTPYVKHWEASSHAHVECVACHDYGAGDLTLSVIKYVTETYTSRPKADVPDANCLASGCHNMETLDEGQEFRKGIIFKHNVHFGATLRGEELRCTSCHNQIVQYDSDNQQHMTVNDKSCFICHFKDAGAGEAITGCNSCHGMPKKEVEHAGFIFNHEPYLKLNVECKQCHVQVVRGDGAVPEARCYSCHVERSREQVSRVELHRIHVTAEGIDCYKCHSDIDHGNFAMVSALDVQCESCHLRQHNQPRQLYMGIGGADSLNMPSAMFAAQVSCTGCHTHITAEGEIMAHQEKKEAARTSCVRCHGDKYDLMFDNWLEGSRKALNDYSTYVKAAKSAYGQTNGGRKELAELKAAIKKLDENYSFIKEGHMPHNIQYALYLMNAGADAFEAAVKRINKNYAPSSRGSASLENSCVTFCHGTAFQPETVSYNNSELPHQMHVVDLEIGCYNCHSVKEHGKTEIKQSVCADCHE